MQEELEERERAFKKQKMEKAKEAKERVDSGVDSNGVATSDGRRPSLQTRLFTDY